MTTLNDLRDVSYRLSEQLGPMGPEQRFIALTEELGELGHALLANQGIKLDADEEPLEIAFAGVLFELLVLARLYGINIERGYGRGLRLLASRVNVDVDALAMARLPSAVADGREKGDPL
jgi:NTP pyrophosphatase (non-canonical NTP hydrolase)